MWLVITCEKGFSTWSEARGLLDIFRSGVVIHRLDIHTGRVKGGVNKVEKEREREIADTGTITLHFCVI